MLASLFIIKEYLAGKTLENIQLSHFHVFLEKKEKLGTRKRRGKNKWKTETLKDVHAFSI